MNKIIDIEKIIKMMPHRYPFLLIDRLIDIKNDEYAIGLKNVTINEPFFMGHFPSNPVMPGVLQIEAMGQTGGLLVLNSVDNPSNYWTYFVGVEECKFRKMVVPGDTLLIKCELMMPIRRGIAKMKGQAFVGDKLVTEAIMTASLVKKDNAQAKVS